MALPKDIDPDISIWPTCTRALRCGGCCTSDVFSCEPTETSERFVRVSIYCNSTFRTEMLWSCQNMCDASSILLISSDFNYMQIVGVPVSTNCAPLSVDKVCFQREFQRSLPSDNQVDIIGGFIQRLLSLQHFPETAFFQITCF